MKANGQKMEQIKNYLTRIEQLESIVVGITMQTIELIPYLKNKVQIGKIYGVVMDGSFSEKDLLNQNIIPIQIDEQGMEADAFLFDSEIMDKVRMLSKIKAKYVVGILHKDDGYFGIWEELKTIFQSRVSEKNDNSMEEQYLYLVREKNYNPDDKDSSPVEVLEWKYQDGAEVSVILPVYNVAAYLPKCIESISAYKGDYIEFLFVDDGTKDESADIIAEYQKNDARIKLIHKENGGCASARNMGIKNARGQYVGFVDSDDFVDETMYYKLFSRAIMGNYEMAYCGYQEYYEDTKESSRVMNDYLGEPYLSGTYRVDKVQKLAINTRVAIWRAIYKKSMLTNNKIQFHEDLKRFDDLPFRVECIFKARSAVCVPEYLYYYRLGRKGQDVACTDERLYVHFDIFKHLDRFVDKTNDRRLWDYLQIIKIQTHGYALGHIQKNLYKKYRARAMKQLHQHAGFFRTIILVCLYSGKGNLKWYIGL